jgi:hypothetical protein
LTYQVFGHHATKAIISRHVEYTIADETTGDSDLFDPMPVWGIAFAIEHLLGQEITSFARTPPYADTP